MSQQLTAWQTGGVHVRLAIPSVQESLDTDEIGLTMCGLARAEFHDDQIRFARLQERAREAVRLGTEWLTSVDYAELAQWKDQGLIFAISRDGEDLFPRYALGADHRPFPVLAEILVVLKEYSSEHLASWFESTSSFLGGARPREILATNPERVLAAARDAIDAERYAG